MQLVWPAYVDIVARYQLFRYVPRTFSPANLNKPDVKIF